MQLLTSYSTPVATALLSSVSRPPNISETPDEPDSPRIFPSTAPSPVPPDTAKITPFPKFPSVCVKRAPGMPSRAYSLRRISGLRCTCSRHVTARRRNATRAVRIAVYRVGSHSNR
ncbi:hypothetical protein JVU11DRAFT_3028 [Chiua virens]|nr:hypothetical protein JVU11DRAFT_3028 [Chiua virens]